MTPEGLAKHQTPILTLNPYLCTLFREAERQLAETAARDNQERRGGGGGGGRDSRRDERRPEPAPAPRETMSRMMDKGDQPNRPLTQMNRSGSSEVSLRPTMAFGRGAR